jgi:hypothetical protein
MSRTTQATKANEPIVLRAKDGSIYAQETSPGNFRITCPPDLVDAVMAELEDRMTDRLEAEVPPLTDADTRQLARMSRGRRSGF